MWKPIAEHEETLYTENYRCQGYDINMKYK